MIRPVILDKAAIVVLMHFELSLSRRERNIGFVHYHLYEAAAAGEMGSLDGGQCTRVSEHISVLFFRSDITDKATK